MRLGLASAARRLYTLCGELITDVQQLVRPYTTTAEPKSDLETQQNDVNSDSCPEKVSSISSFLRLDIYLSTFILKTERFLSLDCDIDAVDPFLSGQLDWCTLYPQSWNLSLRKIFIAIVLVQTQILYPRERILL